MATDAINDDLFDECRSIIEGAKALTKYSKRTKQSDDPTTKLNILIALEEEIQNFDEDQRKIAISLINGPQRIRGLAGSGKTVVLAMKAAHIHLQHPEKKILFTFYTKSLYGLIRDSISNFYRHFSGHEPNWDYIDVLHSWGGRTIDGVYYNACSDNSILPMSFSEAKISKPSDPFSAVCKKIENKEINQKYDYILIDEAQDLPNEFFHICYKLAIGESGESKNIVWAYDDLQSIFNVYQRTPTELFGKDEKNEPKVDLEKFKLNLRFNQSNDLVLYKCYRNPLEVLVTAHALGFGIYSDKPVQMLENREHWEDVGYSVEENLELEVGSQTIIKRDVSNSPLSIYQYQSKTDIIQYEKFGNIDDECRWITNNIEKLINEGIKQHDILVICLDDRYAKRYFSRISTNLAYKSIRSNNLLISSSAAPPFLLDEMVTLSTVHRAKGNEAAVVFCAGIDALYFQRNIRSGRNKIFTAFTRTKAWLKVSGVGNAAQFFFDEIETSLHNSPSLIFNVPDKKEIETIQRDLNSKPQELRKLQKLYNDLLEKGFTEEEIQMELDLTKGEF
nr:ATP-binding domain-containing protein [Shewanella dokdonensis]